MFVELGELNSNPEEVLSSVFKFIGADPLKCPFTPLATTVSGDRRGRRMHPSVRRKLQHYFAAANQQLFSIMGKDYISWGDWAPAVAADEEEGGIPIIPVIHAKPVGSRAIAAAGKLSKPMPELLPGVVLNNSNSIARKDSNLVKRVVSISARV